MQLRYNPKNIVGDVGHHVGHRSPELKGNKENDPLIVMSNGEVFLKSDLHGDPDAQARLRHTTYGTLEVVTWCKRPVLYTPEGEKLVKSQVFAMCRGSNQYPERALWGGTRTILLDHEHNVAVPLAPGFDGIYAEWPHHTAMPCTHTSWGWYVADKELDKAIVDASKQIFEQASIRAALLDTVANRSEFSQASIEALKGFDILVSRAKIRDEVVRQFLSTHDAVSLVCLAARMVDTPVALFMNRAKTDPFKFTKTSHFMKDRINKARAIRESKFLCLTDEGIK